MVKVKSLGQVAFEAYWKSEEIHVEFLPRHEAEWREVSQEVIREYLKRQKQKKVKK